MTCIELELSGPRRFYLTNFSQDDIIEVYIKKGEEMTENDYNTQIAEIKNEGRVKVKNDLTLIEAISMSVVTILAVAVGTMYGTILF